MSCLMGLYDSVIKQILFVIQKILFRPNSLYFSYQNYHLYMF